jgi:FkbM family methyltransferase
MGSRKKKYFRVLGVQGLISAVKAKITKRTVLLKIERPDIQFPFYLRIPSSDILTFKQIFLKKEYDLGVKKNPKIIVDAGANIGLTSICFANKFPESKIIAIEPEKNNFEILKKNTAPYKNISLVHGALWHENKKICLVDTGFGEWSYMTQAQNSVEKKFGEIRHEVQGMTVDTIMNEQGIGHIDILKIDIEGAEREVFGDPSSWISKVDVLLVELHRCMKSGCERSFYNGTNGFDDEWVDGETVCLTRNKGCLSRRST